jgi:hypothetical protein
MSNLIYTTKKGNLSKMWCNPEFETKEASE